MADEPGKQKSPATDRAEAAKAERDARLAGALRNNLRRRNPTERKISERPGLKKETHDTDKSADKDRDPNG